MARKTTDNTTPSQDAMLEHLAYLVLHQNRPACWRDFQKFMAEGQAYSLKQGTIRNNLSCLRRLGLIEFSYRSVDAFYTLPGETYRKGNTMTGPHARVSKPDLAALIQRMAFDMPAAHDIHLRFNVCMIWQTLSVFASPNSITMNTTDDDVAARSHASFTITRPRIILSTRPVSNDLVLPIMRLDREIKGMVTVHKNDTVSVILSCSGSPIRFDIGGLVRLSSSLARIEERLSTLIDIAQGQRLASVGSLSSSSSSCSSSNPAATVPSLVAEIQKDCAAEKKLLLVPEYGSWIVTMWHIGRDSIQRYTGEKFEVVWEDFTGEWVRAYSKEMMVSRPGANRGKACKKRFVRLEVQEYPNDRLRVAVEHKLSLTIAPHMFS
jgi:hypothetical protein